MIQGLSVPIGSATGVSARRLTPDGDTEWTDHAFGPLRVPVIAWPLPTFGKATLAMPGAEDGFDPPLHLGTGPSDFLPQSLSHLRSSFRPCKAS
jgi:hypothetical protein